MKNPPKLLAKLGLYRTFFDLMKGIYIKSKANIILNGEILKAFPLKWEMTRIPTISFSIQHYIGAPKQSI